jgi:hypothetical protein
MPVTVGDISHSNHHMWFSKSYLAHSLTPTYHVQYAILVRRLKTTFPRSPCSESSVRTFSQRDACVLVIWKKRWHGGSTPCLWCFVSKQGHSDIWFLQQGFTSDLGLWSNSSMHVNSQERNFDFPDGNYSMFDCGPRIYNSNDFLIIAVQWW